MNRHSQVGSYSTNISRRKLSCTVTSRRATLLSRITSPAWGLTSAASTQRPTSSGVIEKLIVTAEPSSRTERSSTTAGGAVAASTVGGQASSRTVTDCPSNSACRIVTGSETDSDFFKSGCTVNSTDTSAAASGPIPTE